jgi:hypothetical protein
MYLVEIYIFNRTIPERTKSKPAATPTSHSAEDGIVIIMIIPEKNSKIAKNIHIHQKFSVFLV